MERFSHTDETTRGSLPGSPVKFPSTALSYTRQRKRLDLFKKFQPDLERQRCVQMPSYQNEQTLGKNEVSSEAGTCIHGCQSNFLHTERLPGEV